jgi:hypothetical protein
MSATGEKLHQHEQPGRPADVPRPMLRDGDRVLATILLMVTLLLAVQMAGIATNATGVSAIGAVWLLWPLLAAAILLIIYASRYAERWVRKPLPGLRLGLILAVLASAVVAMIMLHGNEQRCVDRNTMTVVSAANCQPRSRPGTTGSQDAYAWYYLGRGTQTGDRIQGGSFTRPDQDSGGNSNTGGAGGDGSE